MGALRLRKRERPMDSETESSSADCKNPLAKSLASTFLVPEEPSPSLLPLALPITEIQENPETVLVTIIKIKTTLFENFIHPCQELMEKK